jgi:hypothetical protein
LEEIRQGVINLPVESIAMPMVVLVAPLTYPSRVYILDNIMMGIPWVYNKRPGNRIFMPYSRRPNKSSTQRQRFIRPINLVYV